MKYLKAEKEIPKGSITLLFSPFLDEEGLIRAKGRIGKSQLDFNAKHLILLHGKHHAVEWFLRNEPKDNQHWACRKHCSAEDVYARHAEHPKINQEQVCYLQKKQSTSDSTCNGRSTRIDASTAFTNVEIDYFGAFTVKIGWRNEWKAMGLSFYMSNFESGAYRSCT